MSGNQKTKLCEAKNKQNDTTIIIRDIKYLYNIYIYPGHEHPREDNPDLCYWAEIMEHTCKHLTYNISKPLMISGHMLSIAVLEVIQPFRSYIQTLS